MSCYYLKVGKSLFGNAVLNQNRNVLEFATRVSAVGSHHVFFYTFQSDSDVKEDIINLGFVMNIDVFM